MMLRKANFFRDKERERGKQAASGFVYSSICLTKSDGDQTSTLFPDKQKIWRHKWIPEKYRDVHTIPNKCITYYHHTATVISSRKENHSMEQMRREGEERLEL